MAERSSKTHPKTGTWPWLASTGRCITLGHGPQRPAFMTHGPFPGLGYEVMLSRALADRPLHMLSQWLDEQTERPLGTTIEEIAAAFVSAMREVQPSGPYIVLGYSAGGVTALEVAQQLTAAGEAVQLALIDTPLVRISPDKLTGDDVDDLCEVWPRALGGWDRSALAALAPAVRMRALVDELPRRFDTDWAKHLELLTRLDVDLARRFVHTLITHLRAIARYQLRVYDQPMRFFEPATRDAPARASDDWRPWLPRLAATETPGDHNSMFTDPAFLHDLALGLRAGWA